MRDATAVRAALDAIAAAAPAYASESATREPLMPPIIAAVKARATVGEIPMCCAGCGESTGRRSGMYSTCTFCHAPLGRNECLEHFPVGRRLAFDQAKGRLWVVCPACRQWNLSPFETRWEAIEEGERLYRDARMRVTTDHIGLARLRDGTEPIRIGEPLRPEFAAWRYGERFSTRWRRTAMWFGVGAAAFAGYAAAGPLLGVTFGGVASMPLNIYSMLKNSYDDRKVVVSHRDEFGPFILTRGHIRSTRSWQTRILRRAGASRQ